MADRNRLSESKEADEISSMIDTSRSVLKSEIEARFFAARPSNSRLVQCYISKASPAKSYLAERQYELAETLTKQMLRKAQEIQTKAGSGVAPPVSAGAPVKKAKTETKPNQGSMLFQGALNLPKAEKAAAEAAAEAAANGAFQFDPVVVEMQQARTCCPAPAALPLPHTRRRSCLAALRLCVLPPPRHHS